jgi:hypothetical protein
MYILRKRFLVAEPYIIRDSEYWVDYKRHFKIKG